MKKRNPLELIGLVLLLVVVYFFARPRRPLIPEPKELDRNANHLIYSKHAKCRMECRHIDKSEVIEMLRKGTIDYKRSEVNIVSPKYAIEGITHDEQHVRIIFAPAENAVVVVTVIDLKQDWPCDCD